MKKILLIVISLLFASNFSCRVGYISGSEYAEDDWFDPDDTLTVWVLADIQPRNESERQAFVNAIDDMNENVPGVDIAIVAGDIVHKPDDTIFDWYIEKRDKSYVTRWYEIIGNHDLKNGMGQQFRDKLRNDVNYSVEVGNILFIFMSDSERGKATEISDEVFEWWKDLVISNQDKIIVVTTHAPLKGSGIPFSSFHDRQIVDSWRFREVLEEYRVDLWLSGHLHLPHSIYNNTNVQKDLGGTVFIHVSSIRPEILGMKESESRVLTFVCGSDKVLVRVRNHKHRDYVYHLDEVFTLSKPYVCGK